MAGVVRRSVSFPQSGLLLEVVGVAGTERNEGMLSVPAKLLQPPIKTTREYVPALAAVTLGIDGLAAAEVNPFGPVHV